MELEGGRRERKRWKRGGKRMKGIRKEDEGKAGGRGESGRKRGKQEEEGKAGGRGDRYGDKTMTSVPQL